MKTSFSQICVRPAAVAFVVCALCSISGSSQVTAAGNIHRVDFRNFTYAPTCLNLDGSEKPETVKAVNGSFKKEDSDGYEVNFRVTSVVYGDLTGDGMDEAVVQTTCKAGSFGWFDDGFIYTMRNGKPFLISPIQGGDRANGGIRAVRIEGGRLLVERLGNRMGSAIGAEFINTTCYRLSGRKLSQVGHSVRRSLRGEQKAKRIQFERGHTSAVLTGRTSAADFYVIQVLENQTMTVRISSKMGNARFEVVDDDYTMTYRATRWSGKLSHPGDYYIIVVPTRGAADYSLEVGLR